MIPEFLKSTEISHVISWIESHEHTVDLLKWLIIGLLAWFLGFFDYLKNLTRKPRVLVHNYSSRSYVENIDPEKIIKGIYLLEIEVINPTSEPIFVRSFEVQVLTDKAFPRWTKWGNAISLPNRVQQPMGSGGIKFLKNWFSNFSDNLVLTIDGKIEPKESASGFCLFAINHKERPKIMNNHIVVRTRIQLATQEKFTTKQKIKITNAEFMESLVPDVLKHCRHPSSISN